MSPEEAENMVNDLRRQPMVENATRSMHGVLGEYWTRGLIDNSGKRIETLMYNPCDKNYAETMGITIIEGKICRMRRCIGQRRSSAADEMDRWGSRQTVE